MLWQAGFFGGLLTIVPVYLVKNHPGTRLTRHVAAASQMLMGSLLIQLTGGRIETHFYLFGSLALVALYKDVGVLLTATAVVASDHLLRGVFYPQAIYGVVRAGDWSFVEHTFWICFENIFLGATHVQARRVIGMVARQQAEIEAGKEETEAEVQRRTEELRQKNVELAASRDAALQSTRAKSQFLANVSHEIRTPMNGVLGMTSLLLETQLTSDQRDCALTVQRSGESLLTIINDLLDFSKIEAGKLTLERVAFLLHHEVDDVLRLLAHAADKKGLELICDLPSDLPAVLMGDAGRLRQIVVNLVGNAIKFTGKGEVTVRVRQASRCGSAIRLRFEVADTGMGIPEAEQKRLFQAFVQVDGSSTRKHEGTGLGLAISKQLVQLMSGSIGVQSTPGNGSTFWFEADLEVVSDIDTRSEIDWNALAGMRVLVVDDNETNRNVMLKTVKGWGMAGAAASNASGGIEMMELAARCGEPFDVALIDFQMPVMDGVQAARSISEREHLRSTRLILLTSQGQRSVSRSLKSIGIVACMVKPIRREQLFLTIMRSTGRTGSISRCAIDPGETRGKRRREMSQITLRILVAEDNPVNQRVVARMLDRLGHQYDLVEDGEAAVRSAQSSEYDLVLMDCQMPRMDGFEASVRIRSLPGPRGRVAIVALTASAMSDVRERCMAAGMNGCLSKPIRLNDLADGLASIRVEPEALVYDTGIH